MTYTITNWVNLSADHQISKQGWAEKNNWRFWRHSLYLLVVSQIQKSKSPAFVVIRRAGTTVLATSWLFCPTISSAQDSGAAYSLEAADPASRSQRAEYLGSILPQMRNGSRSAPGRTRNDDKYLLAEAIRDAIWRRKTSIRLDALFGKSVSNQQREYHGLR